MYRMNDVIQATSSRLMALYIYIYCAWYISTGTTTCCRQRLRRQGRFHELHTNNLDGPVFFLTRIYIRNFLGSGYNCYSGICEAGGGLLHHSGGLNVPTRSKLSSLCFVQKSWKKVGAFFLWLLALIYNAATLTSIRIAMY